QYVLASHVSERAGSGGAARDAVAGLRAGSRVLDDAVFVDGAGYEVVGRDRDVVLDVQLHEVPGQGDRVQILVGCAECRRQVQRGHALVAERRAERVMVVDLIIEIDIILAVGRIVGDREDHAVRGRYALYDPA